MYKKINVSKKIFTYLTLILFMITVLSASAMATTGKITGSVVNVRSGPGTNYAISGTLYQDTKVNITDQTDDWYKISFNNVTGWVAASLLEVTADKYVEVTGNTVNLRKGPATSTDIVGKVKKGEILVLLNTEGEWHKVKTNNGTIAYIAAFLTKETDKTDNTEESDKPSSDSPSDSSVPASPDTNTPKVILNGEELSFEVPPIIDNGRTLVPLRAIFEAMGAAVEWDNDTRTVIATKGTTKVILPIGSTQPTVNGQTWPLDVPAKIVNSRTLAPLRFVGEVFGGKVGWNQETYTVTIENNNNSGENTGDKITKVVISDDGTNLRSGPGTIHDRLAVASAGEELTVIDEKDGWYQVSRGGTIAWVAGWVVNPIIDPDSPEPDTPDDQPAADDPEYNEPIIFDPESINTRGDENASVAEGLLAISTKETAEGYRVVMKTKDKIEPQISEKDKGTRIVFTFKGVKLKSGRDEAYLYLGSGKNERVYIDAVTLDDTSWVTVNLPQKYSYITRKEEEGTKQVFIIPNQLKDIHETSLNNGNHVISVKAMGTIDYTETKEGNQLTLTLTDTYKGLAQNEYNFSGMGASKATVTVKDEGVTEVAIQLKDIKTYQVTQSINKDAINIILVPAKPVIVERPSDKPDKITIVLDPGHGGKDSGAVGYSRKTYEKENNLKIAKKIESILSDEEDLDIIMTRTGDEYIGLYERAVIANDAKADLFVSIHCDSFTNPNPSGTSTFYYAPQDNPALYAQEMQRSLLADMIQKNLIKNLGTVNRGVKQANFAVIRETKMPSVLVEVGFMSNPNEEQLLNTDSFQQKAAQAIADGIKQYVEIMIKR